MADPIDYSQGTYSDAGVQQLLQTLLPNWNTQWQDPNMAGGYVMPGGSNYTLGTAEGNVNDAMQAFTQQVQAVTGQPPTADQINQFFSNVLVPMASQAQPGGYNPLNPSNIQQAIQNYVPTAFAPQIQQFGQTNQTNALNQNVQTGEGLINNAMTGFIGNLTNPSNSMYQAFSGGMNNMGITPQSGAFQSGLGSTIGNEQNQLQQQLMSSLGFPALSGIQGLSGQPNAALNSAQPTAQAGLSNQTNSLNNFQLQADLAQQLQQMGQPSGLQQDFGMAGSAGQAIGGLGQGMGAASTMTSYVCMELIKRGLLCEMDMDDFHVHIMPAIFKKGRAFWKYAMDGFRLVEAVNKKGLDWKAFKPLLFDRVMEEPDPCKAVDLYADACHQLCISADRSLWDERVFRTSFWDSLIFLPRLLVYKPFVQALFKCLRMKMMFILDRPKCEAHHG
jgi:hypothetical protein